MPTTDVFFYRESDGEVPVLDWLRQLRTRDPRAYAKCVVRIGRLAELGHELRRPEADFLQDGIYELRARRGRVHFRLLYFFYGQNVAILAHALTKEGRVPEADLETAFRRKRELEENPKDHVHEEDDA